MVNLTNTGKGFICFFLGSIIMIVAFPLLTSIITALTDADTAMGTSIMSEVITGIFWLAMIIAWILGIIVVPGHFHYQALTEPDDLSKVPKAALGIVIFIFGVLLTVKAYYITGVITALFDNQFQTILFWTGLILNWIMIVIVTPAYCIFDAGERTAS